MYVAATLVQNVPFLMGNVLKVGSSLRRKLLGKSCHECLIRKEFLFQCMLGAGIHEGGTTEVVLSGLHIKVCRIPRGDAGAAAVLRPLHVKVCRNPRGRNDRSGLIRLAR